MSSFPFKIASRNSTVHYYTCTTSLKLRHLTSLSLTTPLGWLADLVVLKGFPLRSICIGGFFPFYNLLNHSYFWQVWQLAQNTTFHIICFSIKKHFSFHLVIQCDRKILNCHFARFVFHVFLSISNIQIVVNDDDKHGKHGEPYPSFLWSPVYLF